MWIIKHKGTVVWDVWNDTPRRFTHKPKAERWAFLSYPNGQWKVLREGDK